MTIVTVRAIGVQVCDLEPLLPALLLLPLCLPACSCKSGGGLPRLEPPPGTGEVEIQMSGTWGVVSVEIIEQFGGTKPAPSPNSFSPPLEDAKFEILDGTFRVVDGLEVLPEACGPGSQLFSYYNRADGRVAVCDWGCRSNLDPRVADGGSFRLQLAFGAVSPARMEGFVSFDISAAPIPAERPYRGLYRVVVAPIAY